MARRTLAAGRLVLWEGSLLITEGANVVFAKGADLNVCECNEDYSVWEELW